MKIIGIDIGGTKIKFGLFINDVLSKKIEFDTTDNIIKVLKRGINELSDNDLNGIGIAIPAPIKGSHMFNAPNLPWSNMDILNYLKEELQFSNICVINDANAAALGEYYYGNKHESVVLITLGTGVGSGIVINGEVIEGTFGLGGEIGHIPLDDKFNFECGCGSYGCAETVASASGIKRIYEKLSGSYLGTKEIFIQARDGNDFAVKTVNLYVGYIVKLCHIINYTINPEVVMLGGGVSNEGDYLLEKVRNELYSRESFDSSNSVKIEIASLGNNAGIYGAYYLTKKAS